MVSSNASGPVIALLLCATACGGDEPAASPFATLDGGAGSGGATPGSGGAANAGAGGSAGTPTISCAGAWGTSAKELLRGGTDIQLSSPALSPDELELFYSASDSATGTAQFRYSVRASKTDVFPEGSTAPELDAACATTDFERHLDLSSDGLRAYVICTSEPTTPSGPLRLARRSSVGTRFTLDTTTFGTVGPSIAIAKNELVAYSTTFTRPGPPLMFTRSDVSSAFATGTSVPGLETVNFSAVDPSPDGSSLYGSLDSTIQIATRTSPGAPFGAATVIFQPAMDHVVGAPELSQDCRSLYYVDVDQTTSPDVYSIQVRTR